MSAPGGDRGRVLHAEGGALWPLAAALALVAVVVAALALTGRSDTAWGTAVAGGVVVLAGVVPLVIGRRRYSRVVLTDRELRVGRERLGLGELEHDVLARQAAGEPVGGGASRPVGGAWAPSAGDRALWIRTAEMPDTVRGVPTRDPQGLARRVLDAARVLPADAVAPPRPRPARTGLGAASGFLLGVGGALVVVATAIAALAVAADAPGDAAGLGATIGGPGLLALLVGVAGRVRERRLG